MIAALLSFPIIGSLLVRINNSYGKPLLRVFLILLLLITGVGLSVVGDKRLKKKEFNVEKFINNAEEKVVSYIKHDTTDRALKQIGYFTSSIRMFDESNFSIDNLQIGQMESEFDSSTKSVQFLFDLDFQLQNQQNYLKPIRKGVVFKNLKMYFLVDSNSNIQKKQVSLLFSNDSSLNFKNKEIINFEQLIRQDVFEKTKARRLEEERLYSIERKKVEAIENKNRKFKKSCLKYWDSNYRHQEYVRSKLHDPDSFDHVETGYNLYENYAIVVMKYRNKNMFNATVTNQITVKMDLNCNILKVF